MKVYIISQLLFFIAAGVITGCNKKSDLNQKPISNLLTPDSLKDLQALLDNNSVFNISPGLGDISADNYYLSASTWQSLSLIEQNSYVWAPDIFMQTGNISDWNTSYQQIFYCNVALSALKKIRIDATQQAQWNAINGAALFLRGNALFELSQLFMGPYDSSSAGSEPGLPIRLNDNVLDKTPRASVKQTYDQIISDITSSENLLPVKVDSAHPNRPSKPAALALLSRIYLSMRAYSKAGLYADSCLELYNKLLDYNSVPNSTFPFRKDNMEMLFYSQVSAYTTFFALTSRSTIIDSALFQSYNINDLRRSLFYTNIKNSFIRSSYTGKTFPFSGLATDEILLTRAECLARAGNATAALADLNKLLQKRWKTNTFTPYTTSTAPDPLQLILMERRKELPFRNVRWTDIRRLNIDNPNIILKRIINGNEYILLPNSRRYVLPIPPDVIALSGMLQNER